MLLQIIFVRSCSHRWHNEWKTTAQYIYIVSQNLMTEGTPRDTPSTVCRFLTLRRKYSLVYQWTLASRIVAKIINLQFTGNYQKRETHVTVHDLRYLEIFTPEFGEA